MSALVQCASVFLLCPSLIIKLLMRSLELSSIHHIGILVNRLMGVRMAEDRQGEAAEVIADVAAVDARGEEKTGRVAGGARTKANTTCDLDESRVEAHRPTAGLVLEGGGYRGMYTAGVLDVWMREGISFDHAAGVSAGAAFGCNIKSGQVGRALRYNKRFCADSRYCSWANWIKTGDLFSRDFAYDEVPLRLDPFDSAAFASNPMRFTVVCTDIEAGEPVYHDIERGDKADIEWIRASASIPVLSRPVELTGRKLLDGGAADSIPVAWMRSQGYDRTVVVLTQPAGYRKQPNQLMPFLRVWLRKYPRLVELLARRHVAYNRTLDDIAEAERTGEVFVLRPSESVTLPAIVRDPEDLQRAYDIGRKDAEARLSALRAYLGQR